MMLLDTSGLLAILDAREPFHNHAVFEYHRATIRLTHGYVLAELVALGNARKLPAGKVIEFVTSLIANPDVGMIWPDESLTANGIALLLARQGRGYSLCDAVSFVLMRERRIAKALSTDIHFSDEGFQRVLA